MNTIIRLIFCFFIFYSNNFFAQSKNFEFLGTILGENNLVYTYKLVFKSNQGKLSGYSICDIGGVNETKAYIEGTLNESTGQLSFKEKDLAYTKYSKEASNMCYVNAKGKLNAKKGKTEIIASYTGEFKNTKKYCDKGKLMLFSVKDVYSQLIQLSKVLDTKKNKDTAMTALFESVNSLNNVDNIQEISNKGLLKYNFKSSNISLEIWDDGVEDNDLISIFVNDSLVQSNFRITKKKQIINLQLKPNAFNSLRIKAENEGEFTPNTLKVILNDEKIKNLVLSRLSKDESFYISIHTEK